MSLSRFCGSRASRLFLANIVAVASSTAPREVAAQDAPRAQVLFNEAVLARDAGDLVGACEKFEGALFLIQTPVIQAQVASCHEKLGRTASASGDYEKLGALLAAKGKAAEAQAARQQAEELRKKMPFLTIRVDDADRRGATLTQDDAALPPFVFGVALPIDPGKHVIVLSARGKVEQRREITVSDGERAEIVFEKMVEAKEAVEPRGAPAAVATTAPAIPEKTSAPRVPGPRWPAYAAFGVAATGLVVGGLGGFYTYRRQQDARERCPTDVCLDRVGIAANGRAREVYPVAVVGGAVAAVGVIAGGVFLWRARGVEISPEVGRGEVGVGVRGGF